MTPIWLEVLLGFAAPLGWAFWELYALRRDRRQAEAEAARRDAGDPQRIETGG